MSDISQTYSQTSWGKDELDDPLVFQYQQDFSGGEDSFRRSTLLEPNQCQHFLNVIVRDNFEARTRPGADAIPTPNSVPITGASAVYSMRYFDTPLKQQLLVSGNVAAAPGFAKYESGAWTDLSGSWKPAAADSRLAMAQGVDKMLITDGSGQCQLYDGTNFTNAGSTSSDAPVGCTILCWHTQRMFASGIGTAPDTVYLSNFLNFAAGQWNATTRSFRIGAGDGDPIVGMGSMQAFTLFVGKRNSIWLLTTDPSLDDGTNTVSKFTATQALSYGVGLVGRDAWCSYGNDILFMSQDGVRSVQRMQAAAGQWQLTAPISQPIQPYIDRINQAAWNKICAIKYQEFAFFFVPLDNSTTNNYVLVYNGRLQRWLGAWTGWNGNCVEQTRFLGQTRLVFGDTAGLVNQWKDLDDLQSDATYLDNGSQISTQAWLPSWQFGDTVLDKTGNNITVRFTAGNSTVTFSWVCDGTLQQQWTGIFQPSGDILGIGTLPFLLSSTSPTRLPQPVRGIITFNEAYLKIESTSGWWWLKNVTAGAFINPLSEAVDSGTPPMTVITKSNVIVINEPPVYVSDGMMIPNVDDTGVVTSWSLRDTATGQIRYLRVKDGVLYTDTQ